MNLPPSSSRSSQAVTLADVARQANVSPMTVSNVINNKKNVRPQTRLRVLEAINSTGYRANPMARALAGGKARLLSVITHQPHLPYVNAVLMGAARVAEELEYDLAVLMVGRRTQGDLAGICKMSAGALLIQPSLEDSLGLADLPEYVVSIDGPGPRSFAVDNYGGGCQAMQHLLELGHTRIACINGTGASFYSHAAHQRVRDMHRNDGQERLRAYQDMMHKAGLTIPNDYIQEGDYSKRSGEIAAEHLLNLPTPPTAIFASSDTMAVGAIHVAQSRGMLVPEQLSVVGFDDFSIAAQSRPQLTTIRQPLDEIGGQAVQVLIALAEHQIEPSSMVFNTELILRESTAYYS